LFGFGPDVPRFDLVWKRNPLPTAYLATILTLVVIFELLPFIEELARGARNKTSAHSLTARQP